VVTSVAQPKVDGLLRSYAVLWQLWPQYAVINGERRQVGFELELMGSHTLDPNHLDPGCPQCHRVRSILLAIAEQLAHEVVPNGGSVTCDIDPHSASIVCVAGLGNRPCVTVSIIVTDSHVFDHATTLGDAVVSNARSYLAELGIPQR
jgi:hypothetical protein